MRVETDQTFGEPVGVDLPYLLEITVQNKVIISSRRKEEVDIWMLELQSFQVLLERLSLNTAKTVFPRINHNILYILYLIITNNITGIHGQRHGPRVVRQATDDPGEGTL